MRLHPELNLPFNSKTLPIAHINNVAFPKEGIEPQKKRINWPRRPQAATLVPHVLCAGIGYVGDPSLRRSLSHNVTVTWKASGLHRLSAGDCHMSTLVPGNVTVTWNTLMPWRPYLGDCHMGWKQTCGTIPARPLRRLPMPTFLAFSPPFHAIHLRQKSLRKASAMTTASPLPMTYSTIHHLLFD